MTPDEILKTALRQKSYFGGEGGVTFSGGEPMLQGEFLYESLKLLKQHEISTALDTSGFGDPRFYKQIFPFVDTLLLDVKAFDADSFRDLVKGSFETYKTFLHSLEDNHFEGQIWIRHVMLPGYTDNEASMRALIETILPLSYMIDRIEILPYHVMGVDKYKQMGLEYALPDLPPMDADRAKKLERYANRIFTQALQQNREKNQMKAVRKEKTVMSQFPTKNYRINPKDDDFYTREGIDLRKLPLIRHLSVNLFPELAENVNILRVKKGDIFFQTGDPADRFYIVCEGSFKIFKNTIDGREQILYIYHPGDFVGALNLLKDHRYLYTGQALEDSLICTISKAFFDREFMNNPSILRQILEKSYDRIRWAEDLISRLSSANSGIKTAELILRFADILGEKTAEGIRVDLPLNREEMGSYAGLSRETFTRKLGEFRDLGYLEFSGNRIVIIKDEKALRGYFES